MNQILVVSSSPRGADSNTRKVAERTVAELVKRLPGIVVTERDLARDPLPHVGDAFVAGIARPPEERSPAEAAALDRSDRLIDELLAADVVVIAAPMYNFGIPSGLKAWIDHVARAGRTFRYSAAGPEGLLKGKQAILVLARGGVYTKGPMLKFDFQESYLRTVLGFLGLTDVRVIHVEGVAMGPETAQAALAQALAQAANVIRIPVAETALAA